MTENADRSISNYSINIIVLLLYLYFTIHLWSVQAIDLPTVHKIPESSLPAHIQFLVNMVGKGGWFVQLIQPVVWVICIVLLCLLLLRSYRIATIGIIVSFGISASSHLIERTIITQFVIAEGGNVASIYPWLIFLNGGLQSLVVIVVPALAIVWLFNKFLRLR